MTAYTAKTLNDFQIQRVRHAVLPFKLADANNAGTAFVPGMQLPPGAAVISGSLVVQVAFDTGTTATASVGTAASAAANLAATSLKTAAITALTTLPVYSASAQTIGVTFAQTGTAATKGQGFVYLSYILPYASDGSVGNDLDVNL